METRPIEQSQVVALKPVRIEWEGPLSVADALRKDGSEDFGLYMIEGHNILYGCKGGLYFGMACDQNYAARMKQHEWWVKSEQDVTIRLGRPHPSNYQDDPRDWSDWRKLISDVEALTIYWHAFPYNSRHIWNYAGQALRVQNWGNRGNLMAEYSSDWKPPRPLPELENPPCG